MHVVSYKYIREFTKDHPDSLVSLSRWYRRMKKGKFDNQNEMINKFPGVDYVGNDRYVFNIGGNRFRLVSMINFKAHRAYIRYIGTYSNYCNIDCKNV